MTPWVKGFTPMDQDFMCTGKGDRLARDMPWKAFNDVMYRKRAGLALLAWILLCNLCAAMLVFLSVASHFPSGTYSLDDFGIVRETAVLTAHLIGGMVGAPVVCTAGCAAFFAFLLYVFSHDFAWGLPEGGDCTQFVKFRDPVLQARYHGRRIDMETLYEMYFDEKLDLVMPPAAAAAAGKAEGSNDRGPCLMRDILARRSEFVKYTFGLQTHLRFVLLTWLPQVSRAKIKRCQKKTGRALTQGI